jgi:murein L,D-transpeptidase YcbB/YkuD
MIRDSRHFLARRWIAIAAILLFASYPAVAPADERTDERTPLGEVSGGLVEALAHYREIERTGGWPTILADGPLGLGMRDPRVPDLRRRLIVSGDYAEAAYYGEQITAGPNADLFDPPLAAAVRAFQERHGLEPTGTVDENTVAELNVPVQIRIAQISRNLERSRRLPKELGDRYIHVNIPDAHLKVVESGRALHIARVVLGEVAHRTPELNSVITHIELNPWWNAPTSIVKRILIPKFKTEPDYITENDYLLLTRQGDNRSAVDPATIDWERVGVDRFRYQVRQKPGPKNVLGRVVFWFPSKHNVFIHDTAAPELFDDGVRYFSSGCIRVDSAIYMAMLLLREQDGGSWTEERIQSIIDTREPFKITFARPVKVFITYFTAWPDNKGRTQFRKDIYNLDRL